MIAMCMHYEISANESDLVFIEKYLNFITYCQQPEGDFLNYVDKDTNFTEQNFSTNLDDSNGRAIWALGYLLSQQSILPESIVESARATWQLAMPPLESIHSTRAIAFVIKGLYYYSKQEKKSEIVSLLETLANRLMQMYRHESEEEWEWFESYLTYANSILPEAMLCAWMVTGDIRYKDIASESFGFLLSFIFNKDGIEVISNKSWLYKGQNASKFGEQPIDVAYTIMTLSKFYEVFNDKKYLQKLVIAFDWFLGHNRLHQIIYNPCTGGCHDGLEENNINLNQGAESTVSYLMARLTFEKILNPKGNSQSQINEKMRRRMQNRELVYSLKPGI